jgi:tetratricopeptide (TPR) repeat protein
MKKESWRKFPFPEKQYQYTAASLKKTWARLHCGDCEDFPESAALQEAWRAYHAGDFGKAVELGLKEGMVGYVVANKALMIYANYLEDDADRKLARFQEIAARCEEQQAAEPDNANAWYIHAYALGRYSQGISVGKALAEGLGGKIKASLTRAIELAPKHADAHIALGTWHAEIIDKVGSLVGGLTYGAKKDLGAAHFEKALKLNPDSAIARVECANGLVMMYGKAKMKEAEKFYAEAVAHEPADAMERLDVEMAKEDAEDD